MTPDQACCVYCLQRHSLGVDLCQHELQTSTPTNTSASTVQFRVTQFRPLDEMVNAMFESTWPGFSLTR